MEPRGTGGPGDVYGRGRCQARRQVPWGWTAGPPGSRVPVGACRPCSSGPAPPLDLAFRPASAWRRWLCPCTVPGGHLPRRVYTPLPDPPWPRPPPGPDGPWGRTGRGQQLSSCSPCGVGGGLGKTEIPSRRGLGWKVTAWGRCGPGWTGQVHAGRAEGGTPMGPETPVPVLRKRGGY